MSSNQISTSEAESDLLACASFIAENIRSAEGHAEAIRSILPYYLEKNDVDSAAEFANGVDDPFTRDRLLTQVAEKCAAINDDDYAFQLVDAIEDYGTQSQARERIGLAKSGNGDFERAFEIAETLDHPDNVLAAIAVNAAEDGESETSKRALAAIGFPYSKVVALQTVAGQLVEKDQRKEAVVLLEESLEVAEDIDFTEEKIRALIDAGSHFIDADRRDRAIETFDRAKQVAITLDNVHRDAFLAAAAYGLFRSGSVDLADATLDLVADKTQIASTLVGFARHHWDADEKDDAVSTLEEAYAVLKSQHEKETRDSRSKFALFGTIAGLFAVFKKEERAIEIAQGIPSESEQIGALSKIAQTATLNGHDELARESITSIAEDASRVGALIGVADALELRERRADAVDKLNEAAGMAESVPQIASRCADYREIAIRFAKYGEVERAREITFESLEAIAQLRDASSQTVCLAGLSEVYSANDFGLTDAERAILEAMVRKVNA